MTELAKELLKNINRGKENRKEILEEYVDVDFMLKQVKEMYEFTDEEIEQQYVLKMEKVKEYL